MPYIVPSHVAVLPVHNASCPCLCSTLDKLLGNQTEPGQTLGKLVANFPPCFIHARHYTSYIDGLWCCWGWPLPHPNVIPTDSTDSLRSYMVTIITPHSALMQLGGLIWWLWLPSAHPIPIWSNWQWAIGRWWRWLRSEPHLIIGGINCNRSSWSHRHLCLDES